MKTLEEIRERGYDALKRELGVVDFVRFLQQFETGRGDYTRERGDWLDGMTLKDWQSRSRAGRPTNEA